MTEIRWTVEFLCDGHQIDYRPCVVMVACSVIVFAIYNQYSIDVVIKYNINELSLKLKR